MPQRSGVRGPVPRKRESRLSVLGPPSVRVTLKGLSKEGLRDVLVVFDAQLGLVIPGRLSRHNPEVDVTLSDAPPVPRPDHAPGRGHVAPAEFPDHNRLRRILFRRFHIHVKGHHGPQDQPVRGRRVDVDEHISQTPRVPLHRLEPGGVPGAVQEPAALNQFPGGWIPVADGWPVAIVAGR